MVAYRLERRIPAPNRQYIDLTDLHTAKKTYSFSLTWANYEYDRQTALPFTKFEQERN